MSNAVVPVVGRPPALFTNRKSLLNAAAQAGVQASFAVIGYKGRNWRIKYRGEENMVMDARNVPIPSLDVIIVGIARAVAKQWYGQKYTEGSDDAPDCFSVDGVAPDVSSTKPQCSTCAVCPHAQWGSRITDDGRKGKECQDNRRIAVVPLLDPENETYGGPMMLRIPAMSLNPLAIYTQMLDRKGAAVELVATRLGFNYDVSYPLITFEAVSWLSDEQALLSVGPDGNSGICGSEQVARILGLVNGAPAPVAEQGIPGMPPNVVPMPRPAVAQPASPLFDPNTAAGRPAPAPTPAPAPAPAAHKPSPFMTGPTPAQEQPTFSSTDPNVVDVMRAVNGAFQAPAQAQAQAAPPPVVSAPAPVVAVQAAPHDMQSAIDDLLNMPV
jgi:hypothetical protein